jgi:hypothetical protein
MTTRTSKCWLAAVFLAFSFSSLAKEIDFAGYTWTVRSGQGGPGPNTWDESNVWLDSSTNLHLRISHRDGQWRCAEVTMRQRLGFGQYRFRVRGPLDCLDENVVLGLFSYPTGEVGPDETHEIDIEFARWGNAENPIGNYTVWPVDKSLKQVTTPFPFACTDDRTTHLFIRKRERVEFRSLQGHQKGGGEEIARWTYKPDEAAQRISQQPMPIHINLWLFKGMAPNNGQEVEVIIHQFTYTPD